MAGGNNLVCVFTAVTACALLVAELPSWLATRPKYKTGAKTSTMIKDILLRDIYLSLKLRKRFPGVISKPDYIAIVQASFSGLQRSTN